MVNRKGFLLVEETLKLILAVIAIGFLAYLLFALYQSNQDSKNLELAKESLEHVVEELNSERTEIEVYNPNGWSLSSWPSEDKIPLSCSNLGWQSCLCICDTPFLLKSSGNYLENCDDGGICLENSKGLVVSRESSQLPIKIKDPPVILGVDYETKRITKK